MKNTPMGSGVLVVPGAPLVFGDGTSQPVTGSNRSVLPPQATLAGFVRARFWSTTTPMAATVQAQKLLDSVSLRGPWLVGPRRMRGLGKDGDSTRTIWVPAPVDARVHRQQGGWSLSRPARPLPLREDEGAWFGRAVREGDLLPVETRDGGGGGKSMPLPFPLWRLDHVVAWGLGQAPPAQELPELDPEAPRPVLSEDRVHVGLDDQRGTATAEALFTTHGVRVSEDYAIAVDVRHPGARPADGGAELGGRSRSAHVEFGPPSWPAFEVYAEEYRRVKEAHAQVLLRLQLLTPACFGGWRPDASRLPAGMRLVAALVPDMETESGWNMVRREPRAVRRSVPPGAVYWFAVEESNVMDLCKHFWEHPLPGVPTSESHLALPEADGFGQVVPGLTPLERP